MVDVTKLFELWLLTDVDGAEHGFASPHYFAMERWSPSPYINRFLSADTLVPSYGNPQSLNRYGYVLNNPLKYTDPTGHRACGEGEEFDCSGHKQDPNQNPHPPKPRKLPKPDESNENGNERTKDDIVTLPIPTFAPNQGSQPHGPNWTTTAATVAMVALGVVFIGLGVAMLVSGGFMVAAALPEVVALITGEAIGAAAAIDAVQGLIIGAAWYGGWGIAGISTGIKAIENGVTP